MGSTLDQRLAKVRTRKDSTCSECGCVIRSGDTSWYSQFPVDYEHVRYCDSCHVKWEMMNEKQS